MEYTEAASTAADKLLRYSQDQSGWKLCKKADDVSVSWRPSTEFPGSLYKGEGIVHAAPNDVWECLKPVQDGLRAEWDKNVQKFEVVEGVTDVQICIAPGAAKASFWDAGHTAYGMNITICRTVTPSAALKMISPRDFVDVVLIKQYDDGTITSNATNVQHPDCPPLSGYVRGFNHPCGCFCVPVSGEPKKTQLLSFFQTDLGGYLPQSVVDSFFPYSMAQFYSNLKKAVKTLGT